MSIGIDQELDGQTEGGFSNRQREGDDEAGRGESVLRHVAGDQGVGRRGAQMARTR